MTRTEKTQLIMRLKNNKYALKVLWSKKITLYIISNKIINIFNYEWIYLYKKKKK